MSDRKWNVLAWTASIALFVLIGLAGLSKFMMSAGWNERFEGWGLPVSLVLIVAAIELVGAVLLLIPKLAAWGGAALAVIMLGASATHLFNGEWVRVPYTLTLMALAIGVARFRHRRQRSQAT